MSLASHADADEHGRRPRRFVDLYRAHYGFVWYAVVRFGVPLCFAEDAVQDTFVAAYRRLGSFDGVSPKAWLYEIARRTASNERRGRLRAKQRHEDAANVGRATPRPADDVTLARRTLDRFMSRLRPADREIFVLSEIEGLTGPELAAALGRKLPSVYDRVRTVRRRFAAFIDRDDVEGVLEQARRNRPRATAMGWAAIVPRFGGAAAATPVVGSIPWLAAKLGSVGVAAALGGVIAVGAGVAAPRGVFAGARPANHVQAEPTAVAVAEQPARAPAPPRAAVPAAAVPATPRASARPEDADSRTRPARDTRRLPAASSPPTASPSGDVAADPTLAADTRLLHAASAALRGGKPAEALRFTQRHATDHRDSAQADLRVALHIDALCRLQRRDEARAHAAALLSQRPNSPVAARVRRSCGANGRP